MYMNSLHHDLLTIHHRGLRLALCGAWGGVVAGGAWVAYQAVGAWGWPVTAGRKVCPYLIHI